MKEKMPKMEEKIKLKKWEKKQIQKFKKMEQKMPKME